MYKQDQLGLFGAIAVKEDHARQTRGQGDVCADAVLEECRIPESLGISAVNGLFKESYVGILYRRSVAYRMQTIPTLGYVMSTLGTLHGDI